MKNVLKKRFTQSNIEEISKILSNRSFGEKINTSKDNLKQFALKVYHNHYTPQELELMHSLPDGWLPVRISVPVRFEDCDGNPVTVTLPEFTEISYGSTVKTMTNKGHSSIQIQFPDYIRFTCNIAQGNDRFTLSPQNPLVKELIELKTELAELENEAYQFKNDMATLVRNAGTWFNLYETWPEVKELISDLEPKQPKAPGALPPIAMINKLNEQLGIPDKQAA